jgi:tetratricopeptide (TPR) repeat protein
LPPAANDESFARLVRLIRVRAGKFQLLVLDCRDERLRDRLIRELDEVVGTIGRPVAILRLNKRDYPDFAAFERRLLELAAARGVVHVTGGPAWFDAARWDSFNVRREHVAAHAKASLLFWLDPESIAMLATVAIDLWAWRGAVIAFSASAQAPLPPAAPPKPDFREIDDRTLRERTERIAFLRQVTREADLPDDIRLELALELGDLSASIGEMSEAETAYRDALPAASAGRSRALTMGRIADILGARGEFNEALRILREDTLPVFERLGDVHSRAVTMGKVADILQTRGEFDEALRIRREEELPVYERLGDVRSRAVAMGKVADILQARGELDEALRIRREEQLPVFERLGDVRARAVTMGQVADILQSRGELDEALRIHREDTLPVYERLGDALSRAVTMGRIADILQARGELDEALRIRREEELPVYERLGDVHSRAVTMGQIADILQVRGELDEALRIRREEQLPVYERLGDVRERAVAMGSIADILQARGDLDEALRIRREEQLPVYERLGDVRSRALVIGKVADILQARGELTRHCASAARRSCRSTSASAPRANAPSPFTGSRSA